jgi:hypothetical protein
VRPTSQRSGGGPLHDQEVFTGLSSKHQELIRLRLDGLSSKQIAEVLGYKDAHSVDVTFERLRRRIEASLGPDQASVFLDRRRVYEQRSGSMARTWEPALWPGTPRRGSVISPQAHR